MFDLNSLSMGEVTQLEELSGLSLSAMADETAPKGRFMTAMAYLSKRRDDPTFTWSQAEALTLTEVSALMATEEDDPKASSEPKHALAL